MKIEILNKIKIWITYIWISNETYNKCEIYHKNKTSYNMNIKHDEKVNFATFQQPYMFAKIEDRVLDFWVCKSFGLKTSSQVPDPKG